MLSMHHELAPELYQNLIDSNCSHSGPNIGYKIFMKNSQDILKKEFIKLVSDTLALLGAEKRLVEDIKATEDDPFSPKIIDEIRRYNREQENKAKHTVALLNTTFCI